MCLSIGLANGWSAEFSQSSVYISGFSGKLSPVTTHFEDQVQIKLLPKPESGEQAAVLPKPIEVGGREGPEPTRFGDWELRGRCIDF
jgi:Protein of unknown function (DUF1674)